MKCWSTKSGLKIYRILSGRCNSFLVSDGHKHLLIDTGRKNKWKTLKDRLDKIGVDQTSLAALILTHAHFDHAENACKIKETFKTRLIIHKVDGAFLENGDNPPIYGTAPLTSFLTGLAGQRLYHFARYGPADYDITVEDRYSLSDIGFNLDIIHTPGHTMGSISVIIDDEVAIVGDAMFGVLPESVFPPFGYDPKVLICSWKRLLDTNCSIFLPAHGTENSRELLQKEYEKYKRKFNL